MSTDTAVQATTWAAETGNYLTVLVNPVDEDGGLTDEDIFAYLAHDGWTPDMLHIVRLEDHEMEQHITTSPGMMRLAQWGPVEGWQPCIILDWSAIYGDQS